MKRFLKIFASVIVLLIAGVLIYSYSAFNYYSPSDPDVQVDPLKLKYFYETYDECRNAFKVQAEDLKEKFDSVVIFSVPLESKTDNNLNIDFCFIPASDSTNKLLILNSGIHGIEGFTGSAVQRMLMKEVLSPEITREMGILIIHGMNAWGFKHERRVSENNVDLNRNYSLDNSLFSIKNEGFTAIYGMLTPKEKLNTSSLENKFFLLKAVSEIAKKGKPALVQAFAQGQYQYPEAIYFGGNDFEPHVKIISDVIKTVGEDYNTILAIDLHTGYGERGTLHLFPNPVNDPVIREKMEAVFKGYPINWGNSDDFYTVTGQFVEFIGSLLPGKTCIPMVMEYGTLNSSATMGTVTSAYTSIIENQGFQNGYNLEKDSLKARAKFRQMYYPYSEKWRTNAINKGEEMISSAINNFIEL